MKFEEYQKEFDKHGFELTIDDLTVEELVYKFRKNGTCSYYFAESLEELEEDLYDIKTGRWKLWEALK